MKKKKFHKLRSNLSSAATFCYLYLLFFRSLSLFLCFLSSSCFMFFLTFVLLLLLLLPLLCVCLKCMHRHPFHCLWWLLLLFSFSSSWSFGF